MTDAELKEALAAAMLEAALAGDDAAMAKLEALAADPAELRRVLTAGG